jgi:hypothetical protein
MAKRSHTTFQKRQKELARAEKQREKAAKRLQKKQEGGRPSDEAESLGGDAIALDDDSAAGESPTSELPTTPERP